jgi:hypothetical protein
MQETIPDLIRARIVELTNELEKCQAALAAFGEDQRPPNRRPSGTVKPKILDIVSKTETGITSAQIAATTSFKEGSVRGTLSVLREAGLVVQRDGAWFPPEPPPQV